MTASFKVNRRAAKKELQDVQNSLKEKGKKVSSTEVAMQRVSIFLDRWVQINFRTEGGNVGGWLPFKHGGRVTKNGIDSSAKLLQDTGTLRASFTPRYSKTDAGVLSDLPYAPTHHEGRGKVPQRRLLPKRREVIGDIKKMLRKFVRLAIK